MGCAREQLGLGVREHCSQRSNHKLTVDQVLAGPCKFRVKTGQSPRKIEAIADLEADSVLTFVKQKN